MLLGPGVRYRPRRVRQPQTRVAPIQPLCLVVNVVVVLGMDQSRRRALPGYPRRHYWIWGLIAIFALSIPGTAHADTPSVEEISGETAEITVADVPSSTPFSQGSEGQELTLLVNNPDGPVRARGFTLSANQEWSHGEPVTPVPSSISRLETDRLQAALWIATHYYDVPGRLAVDDIPGNGADRRAERAAYQLAFWQFTDGLDLNSINGRIARRAEVIASEAESAPSQDAPDPPAGVNFSFSSVREFFTGERFEARLSRTSQGRPGIGGALVRFEEEGSGYPLRIAQTNDVGAVPSLDLPNDRPYEGTLRAVWETKLPVGTLLSGESGLVMLFEPLPVTFHSVSLTRSAPSAREYPFLALSGAANQLNTRAPQLAMLCGAAVLVLSLVSSIIAALGDHPFGKTFWKSTGAFLVVALLSLTFLAWLDSRQLDVAWAKDANESSAAELAIPIDSVRASSELEADQPDVFGPSCAVDGEGETSWLSGRHEGRGEILAIGLAGPAAVSRIDLSPGWFGGEDPEALYDATGKPSILEVFTDVGRAAVVEVPTTSFNQGPDLQRVSLPYVIPAQETVFVRVLDIGAGAGNYAGIAEIRVQGDPITNVAGSDFLKPEGLAPHLGTSTCPSSVD